MPENTWGGSPCFARHQPSSQGSAQVLGLHPHGIRTGGHGLSSLREAQRIMQDCIRRPVHTPGHGPGSLPWSPHHSTQGPSPTSTTSGQPLLQSWFFNCKTRSHSRSHGGRGCSLYIQGGVVSSHMLPFLLGIPFPSWTSSPPPPPPPNSQSS